MADREHHDNLTGSSDPFGFVPEEIEELPAGTDLGGLRIVRLVGEGGMGRVYEAEQEAPRRTVAVKFMRGGLVSPAAVRLGRPVNWRA